MDTLLAKLSVINGASNTEPNACFELLNYMTACSVDSVVVLCENGIYMRPLILTAATLYANTPHPLYMKIINLDDILTHPIHVVTRQQRKWLTRFNDELFIKRIQLYKININPETRLLYSIQVHAGEQSCTVKIIFKLSDKYPNPYPKQYETLYSMLGYDKTFGRKPSTLISENEKNNIFKQLSGYDIPTGSNILSMSLDEIVLGIAREIDEHTVVLEEKE